MSPTFLETIWAQAYATAFGNLRSQAAYGSGPTAVQAATQAAVIADAACSNLPGATLADLQTDIAALKA